VDALSLGEGKVKGRGQSNWLWIKRIFGFCGVLWGFVVYFRLGDDSNGVAVVLGGGFEAESGVQNVVKSW
jgi:hypothetical protein